MAEDPGLLDMYFEILSYFGLYLEKQKEFSYYLKEVLLLCVSLL